MRNLIYLVLIISTLSSCDSLLPNLIPNGEGEDSDMVVVELDISIPPFTETLVIDNKLTLFFDDGDNSFLGCGTRVLRVMHGQVLKTDNDDENGRYLGLTNGDLVGGIINGTWNDRFRIAEIWDYIFSCVPMNNISIDQDVIFGIRFLSNGRLHYGWVKVYVDPDSHYPYIRTVAYNKKPGVFARVGQ